MRRDCIAVTVVLFLIAIVGTPFALYATAVRQASSQVQAFQAKMPSHHAVAVQKAQEAKEEVRARAEGDLACLRTAACRPCSLLTARPTR